MKNYNAKLLKIIFILGSILYSFNATAYDGNESSILVTDKSQSVINKKPIANEKSLSSILIKDLVEKDVILSYGINFNTGEPIVFDPINQSIINSCRDKASSKRTGNQSCKLKEDKIAAPDAVMQAIKNNGEIFSGFVEKDGKRIPARFVISVSALYEGSSCVTYWSGGKKFQNCKSVKEKCNYYVPAEYKEYITKKVRQTCSQFPGWDNNMIPLP